jgi:hypothetical protein
VKQIVSNKVVVEDPRQFCFDLRQFFYFLGGMQGHESRDAENLSENQIGGCQI